MKTESSQPPLGWRYCGSQCKLWRERAGVTREALAKEANYEYETVKSMELGRRKPSLKLLEVADHMCGAQGMLLAAVPYLKPDPYASYSQDFMRYEAEAVALSSYQGLFIPGLLQTEEMVRALLMSNWPQLDDETFEERARARLERRLLLDTQTKSFNFVIYEAALRGMPTERQASKRQLQHLLELGQRRHLAVQVLTFGHAHPGLNGPFVLLQTPEHEQMVYEEGQMTGMLYGDLEKVATIQQRYAMILRVALSPGGSAEFIGKLAEEL